MMLSPLLRALLAVALTLPVAGCFDKSPEQHIAAAKQALQKSDSKSAIIELKSALQKAPGNVEARLLLGRAFQAADQWANSEAELKKAMQLGASPEQVLPELAHTMVKRGKFQEVIDLVPPAAGIGSQALASVQTEKANAYLWLNQLDKASDEIAQGARTLAAVGGNAYSNELQLAKVRLALLKNQLPQATALLETALQHDAKSIDALYMKAKLLLGNGKSAEALAVYQRIIATNPSETPAYLKSYDIRLREHDMAAAETTLKSMERVAPNNLMVKYSRGIFELERGNLEKASSTLLDVLRVAPDHRPAELAYAMASYGLGHYEQSSKEAGKVFGAFPENPDVATIFAGSRLKLGDIQGALKILEPFLSKHAADAKLLSLASDAYLRAKDYNKAMSYLDKAAELDPESPYIKTSQATIHLSEGNASAALVDLESATRLSDKPSQADLTLVMLHLKDKEYDRALQAIARLEKKLPNNPVTHNLRGSAMLGKLDRVGARKEFDRAISIQPNFFPAAINLARMDMQDNQLEAARKRFESVLAVDKNNVQTMLALSDLAMAEKKENEAVVWLEKAIKADPKALPAYDALIRHHLTKKENARALALANQATNANPDSLTALEILGATQLVTGSKETAIGTYTRLTQMAPQSPEAYRLLALAQTANKQIADARNGLKTALQLQPDYLKALDTLIRLELSDGKPEAALALARQFQHRKSDSPFGFDREGDIQMFQKRYPLAAKAYEQALAKGAGTADLINLHRCLTASGDLNAADRQLANWIKQHPKDLEAISYAAQVYIFAKRNHEAIALYETLLKAKPNDFLALNNLAIIYQREQDGRALAAAEQAFKLAPGQPAILDTLGWILVGQNQLPRALEVLHAAINKSPKAAFLHYHYGVALARSGNKSEAKKELELAIDSGQQFNELADAEHMLKSL